MSVEITTNVIAEIRLRRWAREHYVPEASRRDGQWHPIVLDEMKRKDEELRQRQREFLTTSTYVPLAPTEVVAIHEAHIGPRVPSWVRSFEAYEVVADESVTSSR